MSDVYVWLQAAAMNLQQEAEKWEDDNNPIVRVAKEMSQQMYHMAEYTRGEGPIMVCSLYDMVI